MFTGSPQSAPPTPDQVKEWMSNKEYFDNLMAEPGIQEAFLNAYVQQSEEPAPPDTE